MRRISLLAFALALVIVTTGSAGVMLPTKFFKLEVHKSKGRPVYLRVTAGRIDLTSERPWSDEKDRNEARPDRWEVFGTKIKASEDGRYLAYDPTGKDPRVFLSRENGEGTTWLIETSGYYWTFKPVYGKVKNWHLGVEEYEEKGEGGKPGTASRLVLRKDAGTTKVSLTKLKSYRSTAK